MVLNAVFTNLLSDIKECTRIQSDIKGSIEEFKIILKGVFVKNQGEIVIFLMHLSETNTNDPLRSMFFKLKISKILFHKI